MSTNVAVLIGTLEQSEGLKGVSVEMVAFGCNNKK